MEHSSQKPSGMYGTGTESQYSGGTGGVGKPASTMKYVCLLLRFLCVIFCLIAVTVLAASKQSFTLLELDDLDVTVRVVQVNTQWKDLSQLQYLMAANIIAPLYALASLALSVATMKAPKATIELVLFVVDAVIMSLLFSANGAASGAAVIAYNGNSKIGWREVCSVFNKTCRYVAVSNAMSMFAAVNFLVIIILTFVHIRKRST